MPRQPPCRHSLSVRLKRITFITLMNRSDACLHFFVAFMHAFEKPTRLIKSNLFFLFRCMSIPITMRAIRRKVASIKVHPSRDPECAPVTENASLTTPVHPDVSDPDIMPAVYPSASHEADGENHIPSSAGYNVMSVGSAQAANNENTDAVANPSPRSSLGVYSHLVTGGLPAELL